MKILKYSIFSLSFLLLFSCSDTDLSMDEELSSLQRLNVDHDNIKDYCDIDISTALHERIRTQNEFRKDEMLSSKACSEINLNAGPITMSFANYPDFEAMLKFFMYEGVSIMTEDCCVIHHSTDNPNWISDVQESITIDHIDDETQTFQFSIRDLNVLCFDCINDPSDGGGDTRPIPLNGEDSGKDLAKNNDCDICEYLDQPLHIVQGTGAPISSSLGYGSGLVIGDFTIDQQFQNVDIRPFKRKERYLPCQGGLLGGN